MLQRLQLRYRTYLPSPLFFKITNTRYNKTSHCGMIDFTAPDGCALLSDAFFEDMMLTPGNSCSFMVRELPTLNYVKFQPFRWQFSRINNPKEVLTRELQLKYATLSNGDVIIVRDEAGNNFRLTCVEVKAKSKYRKNATAGNIVNTDLSVEFAPPVEAAPDSKLIRMNTTTKGFVYPKKYKYFRVKIIDPYRPIRISVQPNSSGPDVIHFYADTANQYVTRSDCIWVGTSLNKTSSRLVPDAKEGFKRKWLYISVYSDARAYFALKVHEDGFGEKKNAHDDGLAGLSAWGKNWGESEGHSLGGPTSTSAGEKNKNKKAAETKSQTESTHTDKAKANTNSDSNGSSQTDQKTLRLRRLAALSRYAKKREEIRSRSQSTPNPRSRLERAWQHSSIPSLIRHRSSEVRRIRAKRNAILNPKLETQEKKDDFANVGKLIFAKLMKETSTEKKDAAA
eukprot:CAMPEP_0197538482 /NCGR_PEP_ID=MMETSP1318-20131121/59822_1 /TAXON_ID=552666 /ORGANISM="Partenskyella glossopodia, Strain RCC365" /LENGTH=452 /DNA_ID=CAMNT_0043096913 /DNA_START=108 /DNA_END=1466 /DNA_ORIENTATION=+